MKETITIGQVDQPEHEETLAENLKENTAPVPRKLLESILSGGLDCFVFGPPTSSPRQQLRVILDSHAISATEFVAVYCERSGITKSEFYQSRVPMPDPTSPCGWAAISNNPLAIKAHCEINLSSFDEVGNDQSETADKGEVEPFAWWCWNPGMGPGGTDSVFVTADHPKEQIAHPASWCKVIADKPLYRHPPAPVAVVMPFDFEHPLSKERRTVTLTKRDVFDGMEDYFYDKLSEQICQCESVGETNVVDCNCDEYVHDFEIVQACLYEVGRLNSEPKP